MVTTAEVIELLKQEEFTDDQIKILVPILAYESRVDGVPYVLTALDKKSPSYGLGQANVDTMEPAYWMTFNEYNIDLPGQTEQQVKQWGTGKVGTTDPDEEDVRDFTPEQRKFVIDYMQTADLEFHVKLIKHMFHQKELEGGMNFEEALLDLYVFTPMKFDPNNTNFKDFSEQDAKEAQEFKTKIDAEVEAYYSSPPTTTTTTMPTTTTTTMPPDSVEFVTLYDSEGNKTLVDPSLENELLNLQPPKYFKTPPTTTPPRVNVGMNERSPGITNQFGTPPQDKTEKETGTGIGGKKDKSIIQIIQMLIASINKKRSEQGMEELDYKSVLNNSYNNLQEKEAKIQFPGSGVPLDIEDVLDFLTT